MQPRTGISERELKELLAALPQARAAQGMEDRLMTTIASEHLEVAHLLATMSPVAAHPEFDTRLFQAIREQKRSGTLIPDPISGGITFANWLKSFPWLRAGLGMGVAAILAVGGILVHDASRTEESSPAAVPTPAAQTPTTIASPQHTQPQAEPATKPSVAPASVTTEESQDVSVNTHVSHPTVKRVEQVETTTATPKATVPESVMVATPVPQQTQVHSTVAKSDSLHNGASVAPASPDTNSEVDTGDSVNTGGNPNESAQPADTMRTNH